MSLDEANIHVRARWTQCDQPTGNPYPLEDALEVLRDRASKMAGNKRRHTAVKPYRS